jgi:hypothetical protein
MIGSWGKDVKDGDCEEKKKEKGGGVEEKVDGGDLTGFKYEKSEREKSLNEANEFSKRQ